MVRNALIIIQDDPRLSRRPAEAIRLAAGVAAWKKTQFTIYLHGPAVLTLSSTVDLLLDEEHFRRYLPLLREQQQPIYVEQGQPLISELSEPALPFQPIQQNDLARLAARHDLVLRF